MIVAGEWLNELALLWIAKQDWIVTPILLYKLVFTTNLGQYP